MVGAEGNRLREVPASLRLAGIFSLALFLVAVARLPLMPDHLYSFDSVNLALALEQFDPTLNQPQPPGYPLFVGEARLLYQFLGTPERTFTVLKIFISGLSVAFLYLLGKRLFSTWIGLSAAALFFVNPVFWRSGLTSSLRVHLALFSILVAYFCWRSIGGERWCFYVASIALGVGGGFRPELLVVLLPLWGWTAWKTGRVGVALRGLSLILVATLVWVGVLVVASGGVVRMATFFTDYLVTQTQQTSVLLDAPSAGWRRMVGRAIIWTGLGAITWFWTLLFVWPHRQRFRDWNRQIGFLGIWFAPPFLFHLLVHIGSPGHALTTIPVVCLMGGICVDAAEQTLAIRRVPILTQRGLVLWIAVLGNILLFFGRLPFPSGPRTAEFRGVASLRDAFLGRVYETSYARVRWVEHTTQHAFQQIENLKANSNRPVVLVWLRNGEPVWRKVSFYFPAEKVYALEERGDPGVSVTKARLWVRNKRLASFSGDPPIRLAVPKGGRLVWLVGGDVAPQLARVVPVPLQEAFPLYYTDLSPDDAVSFRWGDVEFYSE